MRYGGHQTFFIREGWLYKGIELLINNPEKLTSQYSADFLGVGKNMAMSIKHWLLATGLAIHNSKSGNKSGELTPTPLSRIIWEKDRYFSEESTWWIIHTNLVNNPSYAASWSWFFLDYLKDRFEKPVALEALKRWEHLQKGNNPSDTTLDRDLLLFLSSYSKSIPTIYKDPEDEIECPLRDLGLITHFKSSGYYQLHRKKRNINVGVMLYVLNLALPLNEIPKTNSFVDRKFTDIIKWPLSPTKIFVLSNDDFYETLLDIERQTEGQKIKCQDLAGERQILFKYNQDPLEFIQYNTFINNEMII